MTPRLTPSQQKVKAQTIVRNMALDESLSQLEERLNQLFNDAPPAVAEVKRATSS